MKGTSTINEWTKLFDRDGVLTASYKSAVTSVNESGKPVEELKFDPAGVLQTKKRFGPQGLLEETVYEANGSINFRNEFFYDDEGREREVEMKLSDGSVHGKWSNLYDAAGRVVERVWTNRNGVNEVTEKHEYDESGRLVRKVRGNVAEWTYSYDQQGRLSQVRGGYFSGDEPQQLRYEYGEDGRLSKITGLYENGEASSITTYEYGDQ